MYAHYVDQLVSLGLLREVWVTVDGELRRSEAGRDGMALIDLAVEWKAQFEENGWTI